MKRRKKPKANLKSRREASLDGVPYQLPRVRKQEKDGKLLVTVELLRPRWQQLLGADQTCERTFGLDAYGRKVYEQCDGRRAVRHIISRFAHETKISKPEAEMAVTKFLRTLLAKGLVAIEMEKPAA